MDLTGAPAIQSPTAMEHEHLQSPLTSDGSFPFPLSIGAAAIGSATPRRRPSKGQSSGVVKRSISSPNVGALATSTDVSLSLAEKRRNKLGYHRTSVACVHCRRRKIRCLLATDDPQSRCSNCIRLKKACNFFPVDQQPANERRPRTGSKIETKDSGGSASSSSSPKISTSRAEDQADTFTQFQAPLTAYPPSAASINSAMVSPPGSAAPHHSSFDLADQPSGGWDMRFFENQQMPTCHSASLDEQTHGFWKIPDTPITPGSLSSYASAPQSAITGPHYSQPWHPTRSMSYGHIDEHAQHARHDSLPGASYNFDHLRRSTIDMPPPAVPDSLGTPVGSDFPHQAAQMGYNNLPWGILPAQSPKSLDLSNNAWYTEPNPLSKVQEEEISHFDIHGMYAGR